MWNGGRSDPTAPCAARTDPVRLGVTMDVMSRPDRAVFRLPAVALFLPVLLFFCITPLATAGPWWGVLFAIPAGALLWVLLTRTTATATGVTAHRLLGSKRMAWSDLDRLEFTDSRWAIAVGTDDRRLRLPMVRPRDLPALTAVAGGDLLLGEDAAAGETTEPNAAESPEPGAIVPSNDGEQQQVQTGI